MVADSSVVAVYRSVDDAEEAVRRLDRGDFPVSHVSITARDLSSEREVRGFVTTGDVAKQGATMGAWFGGLFGLLVGAAFLWVPGFGPLLVAGPLAAVIVGGIEGAAVGAAGGGLLGGLAGMGVSRERILKYEEHLRGGAYLVIANGGPEEIVRARNILDSTPHLAVESNGASTLEPAGSR